MSDLVPLHPVRLLPLPRYEPTPTRPVHRPGQLALPWRVDSSGGDADRGGNLPPPPRRDQLRRIIAALTEASAGYRPFEPLRAKLSESLYDRLRDGPRLDAGRGFVVRKVHVDDSQEAVVRVSATAHNLAGRAYGTVSRLDANWYGWRFTEFAVVLPKTVAAARRRAS